MRAPFVKPHLGELINLAHPINRNLVGAWIFNEGMGSLIGDSSWNKNPGTAQDPFNSGLVWNPTLLQGPASAGAITYSPPDWGSVLSLSGSQFVDIPYKTYYDTSTALSIEVVYRVTGSIGTEQGVFGRNGFAFSTAGTWLLLYNGIQTSISLGGTTQPGRLSMADGRFHHIIGSWDGAQLHVYEDAQEVRAPISLTSYSDTSGADFVIGDSFGAGTVSLQGDIALARLWVGRSLNLDEARQLYQEPFLGWEPSTSGRLWFQFGTPGRTVQTVQAKANIRARTTQAAQGKANIRGVSTQTGLVKARVTAKQQKQPQSKANIRLPLPATDGGSVYQVEEWSVEDELTSFTRTFNVRLKGKANLQVGSPITIKGGYDNNNVTLINGIVDELVLDTTPNALETLIQGRDNGARELQSIRTTFTIPSEPPLAMPQAHGIISLAIGLAGMTPGALDFLDYPVFSTYVSIGKTALEVISELVQPFNQFPSVQYHTRVRDRIVSVVNVNYQNVTGLGGDVQIPRSLIYRMERRQLLYLDQPRLNEIQLIIIRGAAYTEPKTNLGTVVKNEYFRTVGMQEVKQGVQGQVSESGDAIQTGANAAAYQEVDTEISSSQTFYGDKLLTSDEQVVVNGALTAETLERYWYVEPGSIQTGGGPATLDAPSLTTQSASPSESALLFMSSIIRSGLVETSSGTIFQEVERSVRQCFYDSNSNLACEATTTETFDTTALQWKLSEMNVRTHAETTSGAVRTQLLNLQYSGTQFEFNTADTQVVAGGRPNTSQRGSRRSVITIQAQSPFGEIDSGGNPIDPGTGLFTWNYESPYLNQSMCDLIFAAANVEKTLQLTKPNWEQIDLECPLLPMVYAGQLVQVEISIGVFIPYIVDSINHNFTANQATSRLVARRITTTPL